jgi:hypothetical protein
MKYRIAIWAGAGFLVAACWALYVLATFPNANERMQSIWILAAVTCPITLVSHFPVSLYQVLAANTATYALFGLIGETLRRMKLTHRPAVVP